MEQKIHEYTLKIEQDDYPQNPRTEWDNFGTMFCWHRHYDLGDKHDDRGKSLMEEGGVERMEKEGGIVLSLYIYDHSGITISASRGGNPFSCPWDSGRVGYIFATAEDIRKNWGVKRITKAVREKAEKLLFAEVETYDQYLTGDVYGYVIEDENGDHVESCWGFYGEKEAREEGESTLQYLKKKQAEELSARKQALGIAEGATLLNIVRV